LVGEEDLRSRHPLRLNQRDEEVLGAEVAVARVGGRVAVGVAGLAPVKAAEEAVPLFEALAGEPATAARWVLARTGAPSATARARSSRVVLAFRIDLPA
jgi:hypothetical protein